MSLQKITVSKNGDSDYKSLQEAIDSIRVHPLEHVTIFLKEGIYEEKVIIPDNKPDLRIVGEGPRKTIIRFGDYAEKIDENNKKYGTFRTPVFYAQSDNLIIENLTIENIAGFGPDIGQAIALYVSGDKCIFNNVSLLGNQDTLYSAKGRQYFYKCYIEGHVDFIFGSGTVVFDHCTIHSLRDGFITAPSTPKENKFGFVFLDCNLTSSSPNNIVYLGRPWRPYGHAAFIRTWMDTHIIPTGWDNWDNVENEKTARFFEYCNKGPGAIIEKRVKWSHQLTTSESLEYTVENIFTIKDEWVPNVKAQNNN